MQSVNYTGVYITCEEIFKEILIAEFSQLSFDTFHEKESGFDAFSPSDVFDQEALNEILDQYKSLTSIQVEVKEVPKTNWNEEWEKNYDPVIVGDQIIVKASFHDIPETYPYEIVINPKMSFGTGHHATTHLMLKQQLEIDHKGKKIYDFGSGTGVLAIMASLLGATDITATDVDDWCIENCEENFQLNSVEGKVLLGTVAELDLSEKADIILANINKNVLLTEMPVYADLLEKSGKLLLSGFYKDDIPDLEEKATSLGLKKIKTEQRNSWAVLVFQKASL